MYFPIEYYQEVTSPIVSERIGTLVNDAGRQNNVPTLLTVEQWRHVFDGVFNDADVEDFVRQLYMFNAWGITKAIVSFDPDLLYEISLTPLADVDRHAVTLLSKFPGCLYFEIDGVWPASLKVHGYWATVEKWDDCVHVVWMLNTPSGLLETSIEIKSESGLYSGLGEYRRDLEGGVGYSVSSESEKIDELESAQWISAVNTNTRLMLYLCGDNYDCVHSKDETKKLGYSFDTDGSLTVQADISLYRAGTISGNEIRQHRKFQQEDDYPTLSKYEVEADGSSIKWAYDGGTVHS